MERAVEQASRTAKWTYTTPREVGKGVSSFESRLEPVDRENNTKEDSKIVSMPLKVERQGKARSKERRREED